MNHDDPKVLIETQPFTIEGRGSCAPPPDNDPESEESE